MFDGMSSDVLGALIGAMLGSLVGIVSMIIGYSYSWFRDKRNRERDLVEAFRAAKLSLSMLLARERAVDAKTAFEDADRLLSSLPNSVKSKYSTEIFEIFVKLREIIAHREDRNLKNPQYRDVLMNFLE